MDNLEMDICKIYFTDFFEISEKELEAFGAFNISPIVDLPLFIDPFLLFTSDREDYRILHDEIIQYLNFLKDESVAGNVNFGLLKSRYHFKEVHQNCLGFSQTGTRGSGLGKFFANALNDNLSAIFSDFGSESVTEASHMERLTLICKGVGRDKISDFTTNLIKGFLLRYTEEFAKNHIDQRLLKRVNVSRVVFDYKYKIWKSDFYTLPWLDGDYVLLTPSDILTRDDTWINKSDYERDFSEIRESVDDLQLRSEIDNYFQSVLPSSPTTKEEREANARVMAKFPQLIDYYIRRKEEAGDEAIASSQRKVKQSEELYINQGRALAEEVLKETSFYAIEKSNTLEETRQKISFLKQVIESQDGYRFFYEGDRIIQRETDIQILFKLVWHNSPSSADAEVNNGRGPVDFKISRGSSDSTLVEFKLAKNTGLSRNLEKQVEIYKQANNTIQSFKVIMIFTDNDAERVSGIIKKLNLKDDPGIVTIDARRDNKVSASKA